MKLLSDREEIDRLHGRLAVGILIVQDLSVIAAMIALSAYGEGGGLARELVDVVLPGVVFLAVVAVATRWVLPWVLPRLAREQEFLVLFAIAWALALAAGADLVGLSQEVGAFVAGISLASSSYREAVGGRLTSVRDFLLLFFFINLGATLDVRAIDAELVGLAALGTVAVLALKPAVTTLPLVLLGYRVRPSLRTGLALAQVSEFSLILAALGLSLGHVDAEFVTLVTVVAVVTITVSTYLLAGAGPIVGLLAPRLARLSGAARGTASPSRARGRRSSSSGSDATEAGSSSGPAPRGTRCSASISTRAGSPNCVNATFTSSTATPKTPTCRSAYDSTASSG